MKKVIFTVLLLLQIAAVSMSGQCMLLNPWDVPSNYKIQQGTLVPTGSPQRNIYFIEDKPYLLVDTTSPCVPYQRYDTLTKDVYLVKYEPHEKILEPGEIPSKVPEFRLVCKQIIDKKKDVLVGIDIKYLCGGLICEFKGELLEEKVPVLVCLPEINFRGDFSYNFP